MAVSTAALLLQILFPMLSESRKQCLTLNTARNCQVTMEFVGVTTLILYSKMKWVDMLSNVHIASILFLSVSVVIVFFR